VAEKGDSHVDVHPQRTHEASHRSHETENWDVPGIVEHAGAIHGQAVCVQPEIPTPIAIVGFVGPWGGTSGEE
jgi:hypothetical protein